MTTIGVGIIGASISNPGWANIAHLPAIEALPDFELKAIATSSRASAAATADALHVRGYDSVAALAADPAVDLAVVAVKVTHHLLASLAVLDAGKMIFTEWPLGRSLAEAELIANRAASAGVRTVIGLQARYAPAVERARELVSGGYVGRVLSSNLVASGMIWGDQLPSSQTYLLDVDSGAGIVSVPLMHALEAVCYVLGEFAAVDGVGAVRRSSVSIEGTNEVHTATAPDHISLSGQLRDGTIISVIVRGARSRGDNFRWEIHGTDGDLVLTSDNGNVQTAIIELAGARGDTASVEPIALEEVDKAKDPLLDLGATMRRLYAALAQDLENETHTVPDFQHAVRHHRLLAAIEKALTSGVRQDVLAESDPLRSI